jgi:hypothetical protein
MTKVKVLARNWGLYLEEPATVGTFQRIGGIESFTLGFGSEDTDTTDFDTEGYSTHIVSGRSNEIKIEGSFIEDVTTGDRDAGQTLAEDLATKIGHESIGKFRLKAPSGKVTEFSVSATMTDQGGGLKDKTKWGATLKVSGKPSQIAIPDTAIYNDVE